MDETIYSRVRALVPPSTRGLRVLICGAGMVGSWTAATLARMCAEVHIVDPDIVEDVNVGVQSFTPDDIGKPKVDAVIDHNLRLPIRGFFMRMEELPDVDYNYDVVVSAVDSMWGRDWLANRCRDAATPLFIDVRVMGEMVCILTATSDAANDPYNTVGTYASYLSTILPDDEVEEATCGAEGTVYSGMFAAQRVAATVNNWGRGMKVKSKEVWNVAFMELLDGDVNQTGGEHGEDRGVEGGIPITQGSHPQTDYEAEADEYLDEYEEADADEEAARDEFTHESREAADR